MWQWQRVKYICPDKSSWGRKPTSLPMRHHSGGGGGRWKDLITRKVMDWPFLRVWAERKIRPWLRSNGLRRQISGNCLGKRSCVKTKWRPKEPVDCANVTYATHKVTPSRYTKCGKWSWKVTRAGVERRKESTSTTLCILLLCEASSHPQGMSYFLSLWTLWTRGDNYNQLVYGGKMANSVRSSGKVVSLKRVSVLSPVFATQLQDARAQNGIGKTPKRRRGVTVTSSERE